MKLDWNDILIEQAAVGLNSRTQANIYTDDGYLPLITAPMDTVVSSGNASIYGDQDIMVCLPRETRYNSNTPYWYSYGLEQFARWLKTTEYDDEVRGRRICIDVANGNMPILHDLIRQAKKRWHDHDLKIMAGNVGSPKAFIKLAEAGADYIRVGIGNGGACLTTRQTGVGYPMASLVAECFKALDNYRWSYYSERETVRKDFPHDLTNVKIVADGGFKNYDDIFKALACGADYVMLGSIFNKALESAGEYYSREEQYMGEFTPITAIKASDLFAAGEPVFKHFRGMSTKEVQRDWGRVAVRTSEGTVGYQQVEYTIQGWVANFCDYLSTTMSYVGAANLEELKRAEIITITNNGFNRFNK